jgi:hypothetical protein
VIITPGRNQHCCGPRDPRHRYLARLKKRSTYMTRHPVSNLWRLAACAAVLVAVSLASAGTWVSVQPDGQVLLTQRASATAPSVGVLASDLDQLVVTTQTFGLDLDRIENKTGSFVELRWPDAPLYGDVGAPGVPMVRRLFVAPQGAAISYDYTLGRVAAFDGNAANMPLAALPVQPSIEKIPGARENARFVIDADAYNIDAELPQQRVAVTELGIVRGQRLCLLEVFPVAHNPVTGRTLVWPEITVDIRFEGGVIPRGAINPMARMSTFILNPEVLPEAQLRGGNYLIVTADTFAGQIAAFATAKTNQGFNVETYSVAGGTSNTAIKSYIQSLWGGPSSPDYILIVGDSNLIPAWVGQGAGSPDTDLQYACMDGSADWYPDIAIGRFPARTSSQLQNMIDKTLYVENGPLADPAYLKRACFMASVDNYTITEATHNYVIDTWLEPNDFICDRLYQVTYGAGTQDVTNAFNDGRFYGVYSGHGSSTGWADGPPFSQANVNALTNADMYAFVCSFACVTGSYVSLDECFMETWVRAPDKAAVCAWGSSVNSYWDEDDILERRLFDAIFDENLDLPKDAGWMYVEAQMRLLDHYGPTSTIRRYFEMYNLMGDPSLPHPGACSDAGTCVVDRAKYACEDTVLVVVGDCGPNLNENEIDEVVIDIASDSETGEQITLYETNPNSSRFEGSITISATNAPGVLLVAEGDTITATYYDADNGQGQGVYVDATAVVDCTPPVISNVDAINIEPRSATVTFDANEMVRGIVHYGTTCGSPTDTAFGPYGLPAVVDITGLQDNTTYYYVVEAEDEAGNSVVDDNGGACYMFTTPEVPDFFTQLFDGDFDVDDMTLYFIPNGSNDFYAGCGEACSVLPTDPVGGTSISLSDDDSELVNVTGGNEVYIYGTAYTSFYIGSNGYITFGDSDTDYSETLEDHFDMPRVSALFDDLNPSSGGTVSYKQLDDRIAVTWDGVPEYSNTGANTFQIELFFDGTITITHLGCSSTDSVVGLSEGVGLDPDYFPSDLSNMGSCGPRPPTAAPVDVNTGINVPATITLDGTDDGLPDPPAALTYIIDTLPLHGTLSDPNGGIIDAVPYDLLAYGNVVDYTPDTGNSDPDQFTYHVNDGGVAPDGGDSAVVPVSITFGGSAWDPVAYDVATGTPVGTPVDVTLMADDPNSDPLTFHILSLPDDGMLRDPNGGAIDTVPYELLNGGNVVTYHPPFGYNGLVDFTYYARDDVAASNIANVDITVGGPTQYMLMTLDEDPGWPMDGAWEFGVPQGLGGSAHGSPDPTSGYTGDYVLGINLAGDYSTTIGGPYYVTMGPVDLTDVTDVELKFHRWLNCDYQPYVSATVEVSIDGSNWTLVWENGGSPAVADDDWQHVAYAATAADDQATVWFRWGHAVNQGGAYAFSGWNIDDIEIWGLVPGAGQPGDTNCDGVVSAADIDPFVVALTGGQAAYEAQFPSCNFWHADCNEDGAVSAADIDPFVAILTSGL